MISTQTISIRLSEVCEIIACPMLGNDIYIDGFNLSNRKIEANSVLSYCISYKYFKIALANEKVTALIVTKELVEKLSDEEKSRFSFLISDSPEWTFYTAFINLYDNRRFPQYDFETDLKNTIIGIGSVIEKGVIVGENVNIGYNSVVCSGTIIGDNVTIGNCSVIGGNGFQLIKDNEGKNHAIPHIGRVIIGNNVYIGDNSTVSRSLFEGFTKIGNDVKIDNHVHIAHNCIVGDNSVLAANCTMFGSSILESNVWLAPNSAIMNRVKIGSDSFIGASSLVLKNVKSSSRMFGVPAQKIN